MITGEGWLTNFNDTNWQAFGIKDYQFPAKDLMVIGMANYTHDTLIHCQYGHRRTCAAIWPSSSTLLWACLKPPALIWAEVQTIHLNNWVFLRASFTSIPAIRWISTSRKPAGHRPERKCAGRF